MARFLTVFIAVLLALFLAELTPPVQSAIVVPWTAFLASCSAFVLHLLDPNVVSNGNVLQDTRTGSGVAIEAGCNAVEACIMLDVLVDWLVWLRWVSRHESRPAGTGATA